MNIEQVQKLKSAQVTTGVMNTPAHQQFWRGVIGIVEAMTSVESLVARIMARSLAQALPGKNGQTEAKTSAKDTMIDAAFLVCSGLKALSSATRNAPLFAQVNVRRTNIGRGRETDVSNRCQAILDLGTAHAELLAAKYNTNADDLKALSDAIKAFGELKPKPRQDVALGAAATQEIADLFTDLDEVQVNQLDPLMEKFRITQPAFFNAYQSARVVIDAAATHESKEEPTSESGRTETPKTETAKPPTSDKSVEPAPAAKPESPSTPPDGASKAA